METNARKETKTTETRTNRHRMGCKECKGCKGGEGVKAKQQNDTRNVNVTINNNNGAYTQQQSNKNKPSSPRVSSSKTLTQIARYSRTARHALPYPVATNNERKRERGRGRVVQTTEGIQMRLLIGTGQDYRADYVQMCWRMRVGKLKICEQGVFGQSTRN